MSNKFLRLSVLFSPSLRKITPNILYCLNRYRINEPKKHGKRELLTAQLKGSIFRLEGPGLTGYKMNGSAHSGDLKPSSAILLRTQTPHWILENDVARRSLWCIPKDRSSQNSGCAVVPGN